MSCVGSNICIKPASLEGPTLLAGMETAVTLRSFFNYSEEPFIVEPLESLLKSMMGI